MFAYAIFQQYFPYQLRSYFEKHSKKLFSFVYPYIEIKFDEFSGEKLKRSEAFFTIQNYLTAHSTSRAKRLKADVVQNSQNLVLSMDDREEVTDEFQGVKVWWSSNKSVSKTQSFSFYPTAEERRFYRLVFHPRHRDLITGSYIKHVLSEGKLISVQNRQRKIYSNNPSNSWYGYKSAKWSHVSFEHPASFDTLAMETKKKDEINKDLIKFSKGKEYYAKIGKAWKRGYLLYGPPGTGKSTMIAAMANLLNYDVYDLELTTVKDNSELRKLLIETSNKSIIVIEDIDCSLDLTGQRETKKDEDGEEEEDPIKKDKKSKEENKISKVTLSGLLNFIDGLWSACGGERIIVFTTNYVEKLDPALIRRGRMDKHIEMSYCSYEAFKILARNYLDMDWHELYAKIELMLGEIKMTPADVAENLMIKSDVEDPEACLKSLIEALEIAKEEAVKKEEEEARKTAEEEETRIKAEKEKNEKGKSDNKVKGNGSVEQAKDNGVPH
jgi:chaperone BCS1